MPTLLATLTGELDDLRFLLVSGEACPATLIDPWLVPGRRVLNAYGPTEATVTATWSVLERGREVTIGGPLPTYSIVIVDPAHPRALPVGEAGEICIGGIGVAEGYLNRPEQTDHAFISDFVGVPGSTGRIYRTGDLGRIDHAHEIEYLGRIDSQVKIRGYRIELDEIAALAARVPGVGAAAVDTHQPAGASAPELVAYLTPRSGRSPVDVGQVDDALRAALPAYMVPSYYELLDVLPMLPSSKVDRKSLPPPTRRFVNDRRTHIAARDDRQRAIAAVLCEVLHVDDVSIEAHFIDDLGANSLTLATFVTAVRSKLDLHVSVKQLYQHPTVASLAASVAASVAAGPADPVPARTEPRAEVAPHVPTAVAVWLTGAAQVAVWFAAVFAAVLAWIGIVRWMEGADHVGALLARAVAAGTAWFLGSSMLLVGVKWLSVGRFRPGPVPIYSRAYVRFWIARMAIQANPLNLLAGTPVYNTYLRLLGMRVGRRAVIATRPPVCTDLVAVGDGAVVRERVTFPGYVVAAGHVMPGSITIGAGALVCEATVLDIDTTVGAGAQLGHSSGLLRGQAVPDGAVYQGSPAEPSSTNFDRVPPLADRPSRRIRYTATQLGLLCLVTLPLTVLGIVAIKELGAWAHDAVPWAGPAGHVADAAMLSGLVFFGGIVGAMVVVMVVPRVLHRFLVPGVPHPLYGLQYSLARGVARFSNNPLFHAMFGDSAMIVHYLRLIGYQMRNTTQTGSNFGMELRHHSPFLCRFNPNTLVSDGLTLTNMELSATSFTLRLVEVPADTYMGNAVNYPADAAVGDNCLIATKAAVPIDGPVRHDVGLLGSPSFEIPRSVARDRQFDHYKEPTVLQQRLRMKRRTNLLTLGGYLARGWALTFLGLVWVIDAFSSAGAVGTDPLRLAATLTLETFVAVLTGLILCAAIERRLRGGRSLEPTYCSLYEPRFWRHERYWKLNYTTFLLLFSGTPFKPITHRLQGATIGRRVFDDGSFMPEPSLVDIGDAATLNAGATIQGHSLEDGTFKSDRITIGDGCTIGTGAFVHYATTIDHDSTLSADAFLMKGSTMPPNSHWSGNPAREADQLP